MLRDADEPKDFGGASDGDLETRIYDCQSCFRGWRADVVATLGPQDDATNEGSQVLERLKYDSYGRPRLFQIADFNHNGSYTSGSTTPGTDDYDFTHATSLATDINFDGADDVDDALRYAAACQEAETFNRKLYAGYEWDPALREGTAGAGMYHVRHRVLMSELGRWNRRDPAGYNSFRSLSEYVESSPIALYDPSGLVTQLAGCAIGAGVGGAVEGFLCWWNGGDSCVRKAICAAIGGCITGACLTTLGATSPTYAGCICGALGAAFEAACNALFERSDFDWRCAVYGALIQIASGCLGGFAEGALDKITIALLGLTSDALSALCDPARRHLGDHTRVKAGMYTVGRLRVLSLRVTSMSVDLYPHSLVCYSRTCIAKQGNHAEIQGGGSAGSSHL